MKICIVGGIFGKPAEYRAKHAYTPETILVDEFRARGFEVTAVGHDRFRPSGAYDVVHVHHLAQGALRQAAARAGVPFIFTGHSGPMLANYEKSPVKRLAFRYVLAGCDATVALSQREAHYLQALGGKRKEVRVIANGIRSDIFFPHTAPPAPQGRPLQIVYAGQLVPLKGVDVLLKAIQQLAAQWDVQLSLVYQNAALEGTYQGLARDLGIADRVHFLGFYSAEQLAVLYRQSDLLVLPSYAESLPSVVTEALLSGIPVVGSTVGGIPEQVGAYGTLVPPGDVAALTGAIAATLAALPQYQAQAAEMHAYAMHRFSIPSMADAHLQLYEDVITQCHRRTKRPVRLVDGLVRAAIDVRW